MENNIFEILKETFNKNKKYISQDGYLLKPIIHNDVICMDKELLDLLLSNTLIKQIFFKNINGILIFDKQKFISIIETKEFLPNSYTKYTNKIGLTNDGQFISRTDNIVLSFPYKDCIFKGEQNKDELKTQEIFHNEIIFADEITNLFAPKIFTNAKRYTKTGIEKDITFNKNDNLIIKGNNLIVLHSLLKRYHNQIKCIYIDPPYNTGNDSFNYNFFN